MKHTITLVLLIAFAYTVRSQTVFDSFDETLYSHYDVNLLGLSSSSRVYPYQENQIISEGQGALRLEYTVESIADWGGSSLLYLQNPEEAGVWDFSGYESLSINFYNKVPSSSPGRAILRIMLYDASEVDVANTGLRQMEWWYSFHKILDREEGWYTIALPLKDVGDFADDGDGSWGLWLTGWDGIQGNGELDLDKIRGIGIEVAIAGPLDHELISGEFIFDNFLLNGNPTAVTETEQIPKTFALTQNFPNPFNPTSNIMYSIPERNFVSLKVYDILGKEVLTLVNGYKAEGNYEVEVNGKELSSGTYIYRLQAGDFTDTKKFLLLK